jgi:hypothetical protein
LNDRADGLVKRYRGLAEHFFGSLLEIIQRLRVFTVDFKLPTKYFENMIIDHSDSTIF